MVAKKKIVVEAQLNSTERQVALLASEVAPNPGWTSYIVTAATMPQAGAILTEVKGKLNRIEAERKLIVDPINKGLKATNALFKKLSAPLEHIETCIKSSMNNCIFEQRQAQMAAAEKEAKKVAKKNPELARDLLEVAASQPAMQAPTGVQFRQVKKLVVTDIRALALAVAQNQVAPEIISVNERLALELLKAGAVVPGCQLVTENQIAASGT